MRSPRPRLLSCFAKKWWRHPLDIHNDTKDIAPSIPNPYICNAQEWNNIEVIESPPNPELSAKHLRGSLDHIGLRTRRFTLTDLLFSSPYIANLNWNAFTATWGRGKPQVVRVMHQIEPPLANRHGTDIYIHHQTPLQQHTDHLLSRYRV